MKDSIDISFGDYKCSVCGKVERDIPDFIAPIMCCEKPMERIGPSSEGVSYDDDFICIWGHFPEQEDESSV